MAVTNLTSETWVINETPTNISIYTAFEIDFVSNNNNYERILFDPEEDGANIIEYSRPGSLYNTAYDDRWYDQAYRTVTFENAPTGNLLTWLQGNAVKQEQELGYEVTFVTNGGISVTKLEDVEELPTPLPTTTKTNNVFVGWYYDSEFEEQAFSGDAISSNITLYAKWYANMEDFYEDVADAIRSKNGETNPIKHTDFAYKIKSIQVAKAE